MDEVLDLTDKRLIKALKTENDALKEENQEWRKLVNEYKLGILSTLSKHGIDVYALLTEIEND